jgi:hypothetical protein
MSKPTDRNLPKSAVSLFTALAAAPDGAVHQRADSGDVDLLVLADLVRHEPPGRLQLTEAGRARIRREASAMGEIDPFRAQHLSLARRLVATPDGHADVAFDEAESPLAWLARRKGRDGKPLIEPVQYQAGERLRADFTRANLTPNVTSSWDASRAGGRRGQSGGGHFSDAVVAAREQVNRALEVVGPEFADVLLDVCCFLKGLDDIERQRRWPSRSAKVVVQLGLDRLARHYGLASEARGRAHAPIRTWLDSDSEFVVET